ncbi:MAG: heavy metal translocating P-type ATPase, partial [Rickettsiales bacterium]|nr:heavy metal translocating P-type ATPase [Rickettsiales bacterium]
GCEIAYQIINKIGLGNYYNLRKIDEKTRKIKPEITEKINVAEFVNVENGINSIFLAIDGLHCPACVWLIESILQKQENVLEARINLTKKYLFLKWRGSPEIANDLINLIHEIGYKLFPFDEKILHEEEKKYNNELLKCLAVAGFGSGNVMLFSSILWFSDLQKMGTATIDFMHFFSALIALPVIIYAARPFFSSAFRALKARAMNMDLAISVAIFLACMVSLLESFRSAKIVYFDSAVMLVFFLLIGRYLDFKARKRAFAIATEFSLLAANYARQVLEDGSIKIIASKKIEQGMILLVVAGDKIPADATIIEGESEIDTAIISGEALPKAVYKGCELFAGTINLAAPLKIKVSKSPQNSLLKAIVDIVEKVEGQKNQYVRLADRLSRSYAPVVHLLAFITFCLWYFFLQGSAEDALLNATAVLIITCPCALALAVPIVQTITISSLIKKGILTKSGEALEKINKIDVIIFDKTGTLTLGNPTLTSIIGLNKKLTTTEEKFYHKLAASMAQMSKHPLSQALCNSFGEEKFTLKSLENQGFGLVANFEGSEIKLGRQEFCQITSTQENQASPEILQNITPIQSLAKQDPRPFKNIAPMHCFLKYRDTEILFLFQDQLKSDATSTIKELQKFHKKIILLSGDNKTNVINVARSLNIDEFYAEQTPITKVEFLQQLKQSGHSIMMVGDGINDAPSLAFADVSISFAKAADITQTIADIIIQGDQLAPLLTTINLATKSIKLIKQNLLLALAYNLIAVPFAMAGSVTPLIAAIAMSSSSILVTLNSLRILR